MEIPSGAGNTLAFLCFADIKLFPTHGRHFFVTFAITFDAELPPLPSLESFSLAVTRTDFYGNTVMLRLEWRDHSSTDPIHCIQACCRFRARSGTKFVFARPGQNVRTRSSLARGTNTRTPVDGQSRQQSEYSKRIRCVSVPFLEASRYSSISRPLKARITRRILTTALADEQRL